MFIQDWELTFSRSSGDDAADGHSRRHGEEAPHVNSIPNDVTTSTITVWTPHMSFAYSMRFVRTRSARARLGWRTPRLLQLYSSEPHYTISRNSRPSCAIFFGLFLLERSIHD